VVPVRDGGGGLEHLLEALLCQTIGRDSFEVILADDGSTDGAIDLVCGYGESLRISRGPPINAYAARNRGVAVTTSPILAFTDADCLPEPYWLELGLTVLEREELDFIAGRVQPRLPTRPTVWSLMDMRGCHDTEHFLRSGRGVTANLFVRRELFERMGGFDESLASAGDLDFTERCVAADAPGGFVSDLIVHHPTIDSGVAFVRKHWFRASWMAVRDRRAGRFPDRLRPRSMLPWASAMRRRHAGLPLGFDRERCQESGVSISLLDELRSAIVMYCFLNYVTLAAHAWGWWRDRTRRE